MRFICEVAIVFAFVSLLANDTFAQSNSLRFPTGLTKVTLPFKAADNLILIDAELNGKAGMFIFDTGAEGTVVNASFAKIIGLVNKGTTTGNGSAGSATAGIIRGVNILVGGIAFNGATVYSLPIDSLTPALGYKIDGILGNDFIAKVVAEIDYAAGTLTLHQPGTYSAPADAEKVPLIIEDGLPFIRAAITLDDKRTIAGKFEIDTGSTGTLLLNSPVVSKYNLTTTLSNYLDTKTGGVGGTGTSKIVRINGVSLGQFKIDRPITQLFTGTKGDNASAAFDGLLGGAIFRRFKMTVDMSGKRLLLEPNSFIKDEFDTDMSGLSLVSGSDDLTSILIDEVQPGSTAAKAGAAEGDIIVSINGQSNLTLQQARRLLRAAGEYDLTLKRGGKIVNVHLTLKRII